MGKGIVKRWVINYLSITVFFLVLLIFAAAFGVRTYYYDSVRNHLHSLGERAYISYRQFTPDEYGRDKQRRDELWLRSYVEDVSKKESVDVAAADENGTVVCSARAGESDAPTDHSLVGTDDVGAFRIDNLSSGEKVMRYSVVIRDENGAFFAQLCYFEPLDRADGKVMIAIIVLVAAAVLLLASFVVPNLLFMRTIVKPVRELRATAHRIAQGDLETRVDKMYDDEIGELADSINHMAEEIKASDSMKNDFISSVSHELRTPLTAIKGWAETMYVGEPDSATMSKGLGIIINESERLTGMVEELLDFSRIQSGRMILAMDKTDLLAELGEAVYMLRERASKEKKHFVYDEPESMPPVLADKNRLRQVFINIIDNALKYTPVGGVIGIDVRQEDDVIKVVISDTGCGINEKDLPRIKEKFYKANKTVRGSGIGLAVADEIMTLHKGSLTIESKEDVGTTVTITIPVLDSDDEEILKS